MKKTVPSVAVLILALSAGLAACAKAPQTQSTKSGSASPDSSGAINQKDSDSYTLSNKSSNLTPKKNEAAKDDAKKEHLLQITVINFLSGGLENCDVKNKLFTFKEQDRNVRTSICVNSKVEVLAISNSGTVTFRAVDRMKGKDLQPASENERQTFELGKDKDMLRYRADNPYGFTYVMAEEFTDIDAQLRDQWNQLNQRNAELSAQVIEAQQNGQVVSGAILKELDAIRAEMAKLSPKIEAARSRDTR